MSVSNQSILRELTPEYAEELMLKLKLQSFGHLMHATLLQTLSSKGCRQGRAQAGVFERMKKASFLV